MNESNKKRCGWCSKSSLYIKYHDVEWGVPVYDDQKMFECLLLEIFQAGLSWITVLKKRESFRKAFSNFNYKKIAGYSKKEIDLLMLNNSIIRNRLKIEAIKTNAICFLNIQKEFGSFSKYLWEFVNHKPIQNNILKQEKMPVKSLISKKIASNLKHRGFKFIGPKIIYAYMQAIGIVNDHAAECFRNKELSC